MASGYINTELIEERMKSILEQRESIFSGLQPSETRLFSYLGPLDKEKVHELTVEIEALLLEKEISKGKVKKTFTILIEGLQNMAIHSAKSSNQRYTGLDIHLHDQHIDILILGLAERKSYEKVKSLVNGLNALDAVAIKKHYLDVMENGEISAKGGAGLGLITMVMKSTEGMQVDSYPLDDSFLILSKKLQV